MIIIHAVQKLLNISRQKPALYISEPSPQQELHSWYAKLIPTSFTGKLLVMYVHEPSLLMVLTRGKTINGTLPEFYNRLNALLIKRNFLPAFIDSEMRLAEEGYIVSKTNSRSMLASMNVITTNIEYMCSAYSDFNAINLDKIEENFKNWLVSDPLRQHTFRRTSDYWEKKGVVQL